MDPLYVQTQGSFGNQAIIFFHAFPLSSDMWKEQMQLFSKTHYTLAPDLPGFGKGKLPKYSVTFEYYVDLMLNFLKESGIKKSIWCGLSMGGYLALRLYERAPEYCNGLILCDTKARADDNVNKDGRWKTIQSLHEHRAEFVEDQWINSVSPAAYENVKCKKRFQDIVAKNTEEGMSAGLVALTTRTDTSDMLSRINVPTLILVGEKDSVTPLREAVVLQRAIPDSRIEIIRGAGHLSNLEKPADFNKAISDFLMTLTHENLQSNLMN